MASSIQGDAISPVLHNSDFTIELCTKNHDLKKVAELVNVAYMEKWPAAHWVDRISEQELNTYVSDPNKRVYICLSPKNSICGTALITRKSNDEAEFEMFSVHSDYRGQKLDSGQTLGSLLLIHAEKEAFETFHIKTITLITIPGKLVRYYQSHGYQIIREERFSDLFPNENKDLWGIGECLIRMAKTL